MTATIDPTCDNPRCSSFVEGDECIMTGRLCEKGNTPCQCHDPIKKGRIELEAQGG